MKGRPRAGLAASLAAAASALLGFLVTASASAQLSPGELSQAHTALEGAAHCLDCHAPRQGVAASRCLDCHTALRRRMGVGEGLHARPEYRACESCHIEHHGREFELIFWGDGGRNAFDHRQAGWPLEGRHAAAACLDCHRPENLVDPAALRAGNANPATTFLGLATACLTCHQDEHRGQLGTASCQDCHSTSAWKPAPGFDHGKTDFALLGGHARLACAACHDVRQDEAGSFLQLTGIAHASCADCHADPHAGRLGQSCESCHSPTSWARVDTDRFDHSRTRFPLTGLHARLSCSDCHQAGRPGRRRLAFSSCSDCHSDPHQGRLGSACASCHDTSGWKSGAAAEFDHSRTRFPLQGEHRGLSCVQCHTSGRAVGGRLAFAACSDCHADPHLGQLRTAAGGGACTDCHTVAGFVPSTFTVEDHQRSRFPLDGAHLAVACLDCHRPVEPERLAGEVELLSSRGRRVAATTPAADTGVETVRRFRFSSRVCEACHLDPHGGTTAALGVACAACHSTDSFLELAPAGFDHEAVTGFALEGGHEGASCVACHRSGTEGVRFERAPTACAYCHEDPHFGTVSTPDPAGASPPAVACADCHRVESWQAVRFDHARDAGFALEGAHSRLACSQCHRSTEARDRPVPPPTTCEGCHGQEPFMSASSSRP